jgi:hypothetical protein
MKYGKLIGFGVLLYAVVFLIMSGFTAYGSGDTFLTKIIALVALAIVAYLAGKNLRAGSMGEIIKYSLGWLIIVAILDYFFTLPFATTAVYSQWNLWVGYAIILLLPLITLSKGGSTASMPTSAPTPTPTQTPENPANPSSGAVN